MSVAIRKVPGVESAKVSLNKGEALLKLKPGNSVTVERIRQIVLDNGFTPTDSEVEVVGKIIERSGKPALSLSGVELVYLLADHRSAKGKVDELSAKAHGKEALVKGRLPKTTTKGRAEEPRVLEIREFSVLR